MCGTCAFSVSEMQAHYILSGAGYGFTKVSENELELLMCDTCAFSVSEMQAHYILSGAGYGFTRAIVRIPILCTSSYITNINICIPKSH